MSVDKRVWSRPALIEKCHEITCVGTWLFKNEKARRDFTTIMVLYMLVEDNTCLVLFGSHAC